LLAEFLRGIGGFGGTEGKGLIEEEEEEEEETERDAPGTVWSGTLQPLGTPETVWSGTFQPLEWKGGVGFHNDVRTWR
jgi:hypothetical protein